MTPEWFSDKEGKEDVRDGRRMRREQMAGGTEGTREGRRKREADRFPESLHCALCTEGGCGSPPRVGSVKLSLLWI